MKDWTAFYDYVLPFVPGASTDLVDLQLRNSAIEFLEEAGIADYDIDPITLREGVSTYSLSLEGADYISARIKAAWTPTKFLHPTTTDSLDKNVYAWRDRRGPPETYFQEDPTTIRVYPTPDSATDGTTLGITLTLKPTRDAVGVDDFVFDRYVESIAHGAIFRMASMPQKPWTNPEVAAKAAIEFKSGIRDARIEVNKSFTRASLKVRLRRDVRWRSY